MTTTPTKNESLPDPSELPTMQDAVDAGDGTLHGAIDYWQQRALSAEAALTRDTPPEAVVGVPAGWRLVPIEPTWDMRNEGREFLIDGLEKEPEKLTYFLWKTMVAAAPEVK